MIPSLLALSNVMGTGWFAADAANVKPGAAVAVTQLEKDALRLVAEFYTNREIAEQLSRHVDDVADAKASAMRKLGLATRIHVLKYAQSHGWREHPERIRFRAG